MNVKVYYSAYRSADGAALYYGGGPDVGQFIRRGRIESYYTRADGSAAITMECFGVSPNGLKVELWSSCEDKPEDAVKNRAAAVDAYDGEGDEFGAAREAAARSTDDNRGLVRTIASMPAELADAGRAAADPYEFFEIAGAALGIYRVDVDGEVYWTLGEE
ncbi:hypothetical protein [Collinsella aerofaciens]|uniref:hypothetical protein n=1 Tax=Collinsella aerofaciens TaxID=74426 RepID=UPI001485AA72|nr:hypothetical protein [Collinsella aerofaciens]MDB1876506.1 hypothetical protein [Collinsella aerofaciens]